MTEYEGVTMQIAMVQQQANPARPWKTKFCNDLPPPPVSPMTMKTLAPLWLLLLILFIPTSTLARTLNGFDIGNALVPAGEIMHGGPPRDGIPALDAPKFVPAAHADYLKADDRVLGVKLGGQAKAYPVAVLNWHEIVNDRTGGQRFVVTYCPLCGTGMVFAAEGAGDASFGVSGLLYNNDMLLYDRRTNSLWSQIMKRAIAGPLKGTALRQLPAYHTTWADWHARHPGTLVLDRDTGFKRDYRKTPYLGYEKTPELYFPLTQKTPGTHHPKALVVGVEIGGVRKAYPFDVLRARGQSRYPDIVNGTRIVVHWNGQAGSAYITDTNGLDMPSTTAYWFAWHAFWPDALVFGSGD